MHILKQQSKTETGGPGVGGEKTWKEVTIRRTAVIVGQRLERVLRYSHPKKKEPVQIEPFAGPTSPF